MTTLEAKAAKANIVSATLRGVQVWLCSEDLPHLNDPDFLRYWADLREALDANGEL